MTKPNEDPVRDLRELPACDISARTAERVRKTVLAAFIAERGGSHRPSWIRITIRAGRVATPIFLAGTIGAYLTWAFGVAISVYN